MKKSFRKKAMLVLTLVVLVGGGLVYWKIAQGVTRTWDGGEQAVLFPL